MQPARITAIMSGSDRSLRARCMRGVLACAEVGYRMVVAGRNRMFDLGLRKARSLPRPVISVGNITTGGTGKTPMVAHLVRMLREMEARPAILTRGYGGDENLMLADLVNADNNHTAAVPIEKDSNRHRGGMKVLAADADIGAFVLDDGFQHRQLSRDLDLVLIDATQPFGFGHVLPRGLLREGLSGLRRADAIILTRCDQVAAAELERLERRLLEISPRVDVIRSVQRWSGYETGGIDAHDPFAMLPADALAKSSTAGIVGIGNPGAFERMLRGHAGKIVSCKALPDHHEYTGNELMRMIDEAAAQGADTIVTTAKDWVKWKPLLAGQAKPQGVRIVRPVLTMGFTAGAEKLEALLRRCVKP